MAKQRKELGDYEIKIQEYFRKNKNNLRKCSKPELNYILGIDRKYIYDCRRRGTKWQKEFLKEYDKACLKIGIAHLNPILEIPQYIWAYLRTNHKDMFDDLNDNQNLEENNNITINLPPIRNIENE